MRALLYDSFGAPPRVAIVPDPVVPRDGVIVEVKARPEIDPFNKAQVLHYLKATDLEVGLLVNFGRRPEFDA